MITPTFIGQRYKDTNTGNIWIANSTTAGDWSMELQNLGLKWTSSAANISPYLQLVTSDGLSAGVASLIYEGVTSMGLSFNFCADLVSLSFPNLTGIDSGDLESYSNQFTNNPAMTSFSAPLLNYVSGEFIIGFNPLLTAIDIHSLGAVTYGTVNITNCAVTSLNLSSLVTAAKGFSIINNTSLVSVDLSSFVPTNGKGYSIAGCALNAAAVNSLLARAVANAGYVSGQITLSGGTNAAPTGQGITDKNTLNARLAGLAVTN